jgi:hypothetical protein
VIPTNPVIGWRTASLRRTEKNGVNSQVTGRKAPFRQQKEQKCQMAKVGNAEVTAITIMPFTRHYLRIPNEFTLTHYHLSS